MSSPSTTLQLYPGAYVPESLGPTFLFLEEVQKYYTMQLTGHFTDKKLNLHSSFELPVLTVQIHPVVFIAKHDIHGS